MSENEKRIIKRPGGPLAARPLHFFWIADCSGSMKTDGKIQALNTAIREAIPNMVRVADENPYAKVFVRSIKFSTGAAWHMQKPTEVHDFRWQDLSANGLTDMGEALSLAARQLTVPPMEQRALPPVLVLISDGKPTDDFAAGLKDLTSIPWGKKAVRVSIAIGEDADIELLQQFMGHSDFPVLRANNPEMLVNCIRWVSTVVLQTVSAPHSMLSSSGEFKKIPVPAPITLTGPISAPDVW